jgi:hypothetical protein
MLVKLKRLTAKIVAALAIVLACTASYASVDAEAAGNTYTVTFRAGNVGRFDTSKIASSDKLEVQKNYIRFTLDKGESLVSDGFFNSNDELNSMLHYAVTVDDNYMLLDFEDVCSEERSRNTEFVLDYARLVDSVMYTVYYIDSFSGEQIASPTIAYGNDGDVISGISPLAISGYSTTDTATSLTLAKDGENTVAFYYSTNDVQTVTNTVTVYVPGDTVIVNEAGETVTVNTGAANAAVANAAGNAAGVAAAAGNAGVNAEGVDAGNAAENGENAEEIAEEEVPLGANGEEEEGEAEEGVTIADEEVPLGALVTQNGAVQAGLIGAGVILVAAAVAIKAKAGKKKTK